ncbi:aldo/keto reductase family oxidoreductase [Brevibacillus sp. SYP-B805]|uniref:aldo/keto reductase n=1 Tax=Brevibacillus sp. SYP-B805 TaxID=1578199 RepID=UPI0013EDE670|nr:aldo/keto reductase [Brevibacillus sp. SYP-B805]NGQ95195.1 aldo/keto reductase family oxidoreductase [Brevibacillus sp. SYP-B805]
MEREKLQEDLEFSRMVYGMWRLAEWNMTTKEIIARIEGCLELGITTFDHADIYGNYTCEERFGEALAQQPALRERMEIVTKCGIRLVSPHRPANRIKHYDTSKEHIIQSVNQSLKNFRTDTIDLLLIHRPDPLMNPEEVAEAFAELKKEGKVRHFGVSNFLPSQFDMLQSYLDVPLVTNQVEVSVAHLNQFDNGTIDHCLRNRIKPMVWSPVAGGRLFSSDEERYIRLRGTLSAIAKEVNAASIDQVMYAWILQHPATMLPIIGSGNFERVTSAVQALEIKLTRQHWFEIWRSSLGRDVD